MAKDKRVAKIDQTPSSDRGFLDTLFEPFRSRRHAPTKTLGSGGTAVFGGMVQESEKNFKLQGRERHVTFSELLANVSIIAAGTRYFLNLVSKAGWKAEPADDSPRAQELAEMVEKLLFEGMTTPWHRVVRRAAMYRFHGFSIQEWTATRRDDGVVGFLDVEARPQITIERWDLDATGTVHGVTQRQVQNQQEIYIPRAKMMYMVDDSLSDSPEGLGLFRHMVSPAYRLCRFEQLEAFGFETDLRGIPLGRAPLAAIREAVASGKISEAQARDAVDSLKTFIQQHIKNPGLGLYLDSITYRNQDEAASPSTVRQWDLELLKGDSNSSEQAVGEAIMRLNTEMARVLGVEGLLLGGSGSSGNALALGRDKSHNFALIVDSTLQELAETARADLLGPLWLMNGWEEDLMPKLKTEATRYRDVEQITAALRDMATAGATLGPDDPVVGEVRDLMGLSRPPEVSLDDLMEDAALGGTGGPGGSSEEDEEEVPETEPEAGQT